MKVETYETRKIKEIASTKREEMLQKLLSTPIGVLYPNSDTDMCCHDTLAVEYEDYLEQQGLPANSDNLSVSTHGHEADTDWGKLCMVAAWLRGYDPNADPATVDDKDVT